MKKSLELIFTFIKIGASTFGGGYAMVPVLDRELIKKKGWLTMDEVMDYYTIAQVTPGIIAINVSTFVGCKRMGALGGILATVAFMLPGVILMTAVSLFLSRFAEYETVRHAFAGIRVAVGALVLDTVWKLVKGLFAKSDKQIDKLRRIAPLVIAVAAFALSAVLSASPVFIILGAGVAGFLLWGPFGKNKAAAEKTAAEKGGGEK
jgi:chromate transporter